MMVIYKYNFVDGTTEINGYCPNLLIPKKVIDNDDTWNYYWCVPVFEAIS